jgi:hypothetical protein
MLLEVLGGIVILTSHIVTNLTSTSNKTCGLDTCSIGLLTCPTIFKLAIVINLTGDLTKLM